MTLPNIPKPASLQTACDLYLTALAAEKTVIAAKAAAMQARGLTLDSDSTDADIDAYVDAEIEVQSELGYWPVIEARFEAELALIEEGFKLIASTPFKRVAAMPPEAEKLNAFLDHADGIRRNVRLREQFAQILLNA